MVNRPRKVWIVKNYGENYALNSARSSKQIANGALIDQATQFLVNRECCSDPVQALIDASQAPDHKYVIKEGWCEHFYYRPGESFQFIDRDKQSFMIEIETLPINK